METQVVRLRMAWRSSYSGLLLTIPKSLAALRDFWYMSFMVSCSLLSTSSGVHCTWWVFCSISRPWMATCQPFSRPSSEILFSKLTHLTPSSQLHQLLVLFQYTEDIVVRTKDCFLKKCNSYPSSICSFARPKHNFWLPKNLNSFTCTRHICTCIQPTTYHKRTSQRRCLPEQWQYYLSKTVIEGKGHLNPKPYTLYPKTSHSLCKGRVIVDIDG